MANERIRREAKSKGVRLWQIAECLGVSEITVSRKLRRELSADEEAKILRIITDIDKQSTGCANLMEPERKMFTDEFGAVLNCAVRYCIGRRTYMPKLVMDVIRPLLPALTDKTLWCFERDIEGADDYGADYDEEEWMRFLSEVKAEIARRNESADGE